MDNDSLEEREEESQYAVRCSICRDTGINTSQGSEGGRTCQCDKGMAMRGRILRAFDRQGER